MSAAVHREAREHSIRELIARLVQDLLLLLMQEVALAKAELMARGATVGAGAVTLMVAAAFGIFGFAAFTAAVILAVSLALAGWAAALIVAAAWGCIAAICAATAFAGLRRAWPLTPQTVETLKEDLEWARSRATSDLS
jgi:hypothetical protein